jgi:hypothetical protein
MEALLAKYQIVENILSIFFSKIETIIFLAGRCLLKQYSARHHVGLHNSLRIFQSKDILCFFIYYRCILILINTKYVISYIF